MDNKTLLYKRIVLKLSGEAFTKGSKGIDIEEIKSISREIIEVANLGIQMAIVIGGGNFIRGNEICKDEIIKTATGDYMGMLATLINSLALQDTLESLGANTRVLSAIIVQSIAEPFIRRRAIRHLEKGRIIILASGTGSPYFTTDTASALRASEIGAQVLLKATKVDGVYDDDPIKNPNAKFYQHLTYLEYLNKGLRVIDNTAVTMCMENHIPIIVFNIKKKGNIMRIIKGEKIGTTIS